MTGRGVAAGLAVAGLTAAAFLVVPASDPSPDGLQKIARDHDLEPRVDDPGTAGRAAYSLPTVEDRRLEISLAAIAGAGISFVVACGAAWSLARTRASRDGGGGS